MAETLGSILRNISATHQHKRAIAIRLTLESLCQNHASGFMTDYEFLLAVEMSTRGKPFEPTKGTIDKNTGSVF
jgi:hypothetical protein